MTCQALDSTGGSPRHKPLVKLMMQQTLETGWPRQGAAGVKQSCPAGKAEPGPQLCPVQDMWERNGTGALRPRWKAKEVCRVFRTLVLRVLTYEGDFLP